MAAYQMLSAVIQSTVLQTIGAIATHLKEGAYDALWDDTVFANWSLLVMNRTSPALARQDTIATAATSVNNNNSSAAMALTGTPNTTNSSSSSYPNTTSSPNPESFYGWVLSNAAGAFLLLSVFFYPFCCAKNPLEFTDSWVACIGVPGWLGRFLGQWQPFSFPSHLSSSSRHTSELWLKAPFTWL
ncbi:hypothetical protein PG994_013455 [Apiospora phragmitis]|uniref:Uncharacterized protein n=1 Tax=Apiospora phragmitis TaxID=2905665 RepID=A0ABR1T8P5_9PEZI